MDSTKRAASKLLAVLLCISPISGLGQKTAAPTASTETQRRIERIETESVEVPGAPGEAPSRLSLAQLMKAFHVPGLSIAVVEKYRIVWAKGYGVIEPGSNTPVTTHTLFQAGSISKPVAATGAMVLVQQGKLALDEDVNQKLKSWKVPENEFTATEKVTLRRLMSHTAGLTVHGFPGYDVDAPRPTLVQVFDGQKPANTGAIRVDFVPGTQWRYSGGGITIEQQLMMDVTGKPFPAMMRDLVLDKIGMNDSSYEQPLPATRAAMTAGGAYRNGKGVHGKWHVYPEMAAAGLWTTPTDLAKFAIEMALAKQGKSNRVLSQDSVKEMLTPIKNDVGLGFFLDKNNPGQFGHNGDDEGFQAFLTMNADTGDGMVVMADSANGIVVADLLLRRVLKEFAWNYTPGRVDPGDELYLLAVTRGLPAALQRYDDMKKLDQAGERTMNWLGYQLLYSGMEQDGIKAFQTNVQDYPQSGNAYDSLGEAYMVAGQKDLAIQNYEKSLQLTPDNKNAVEQLKELKGEAGMNPKVMQQDGFTVIGISARTTNAKEMTGDGVIGKLWGRFMAEGFAGKIPKRADRNLIAIYTDYAGDHDGEYTVVVGARVTSDAEVPAGMVAKKVQAGKYALFTTEKGPAPKVVPELWMKINSLPKSAAGGDRVYAADFELYDERASDPQNLQADVYIGIK